jgi:hypothetical protein
MTSKTVGVYRNMTTEIKYTTQDTYEALNLEQERYGRNIIVPQQHPLHKRDRTALNRIKPRNSRVQNCTEHKMRAQTTRAHDSNA